MKIFELHKPDDNNQLFTVLIKDNDGQNHICALIEQNGMHYVHTGSAIHKNFVRYDFTKDQEKALNDFINDKNAFDRVYFNGIE